MCILCSLVAAACVVALLALNRTRILRGLRQWRRRHVRRARSVPRLSDL